MQTAGSFLALRDADTLHSCYLHGPVLQRMVENYERGVANQLNTGLGEISAEICRILDVCQLTHIYSCDEDPPRGNEGTTCFKDMGGKLHPQVLEDSEVA